MNHSEITVIKWATKKDLSKFKGIIYRIVNIINGKCYIGESKNSFIQRYRGKWWKRINNILVIKAVKKYGEQNFKIQILHTGISDETTRFALETFYIKNYNSMSPNGYNLDSGGIRNKKASNYTKVQQSKNITKIKDFCLKDEIGNIHVFKSIREFCLKYGASTSHVGSVINGQIRTCKGFSLVETDRKFFNKNQKIRYLKNKTGRVFEIHSIREFATRYNCDAGCLCKLLNNETDSHNGFYRLDYEKKRIKSFTLNDNGKLIKLTEKAAFEKERKLPRRTLHRLINGKIKEYDGIKLEKVIYG